MTFDVRPVSSVPALPGDVPPVLAKLWSALTVGQQAALRPHILGDTSADWLASTLTEHGHKIGATTIKTYRRSFKEV